MTKMKQQNRFSAKHPYIAAVCAGVLCMLLTAISSAVPQILGLAEPGLTLCMAGGIALSAIVGAAIMKISGTALPEYGFNKNIGAAAAKVWFYIPLILIEIIPVVLYGFNRQSIWLFAITALFTVAIGFNEEIYFRGLALRFIRAKGAAKAIIWSSVIFGVLHFVNLFNGRNLIYVSVQILFACVVGFVWAEIVSVTGNLWVVIISHTVHDFISMSTPEIAGLEELLLTSVQVVIVLVYAVGIWKEAAKGEPQID